MRVAELKKSTRHLYTPPSVSCTFFIWSREFLPLLSSMAKNRRSPKSFAIAECVPNFTFRSRESMLLFCVVKAVILQQRERTRVDDFFRVCCWNLLHIEEFIRKCERMRLKIERKREREKEEENKIRQWFIYRAINSFIVTFYQKSTNDKRETNTYTHTISTLASTTIRNSRRTPLGVNRIEFAWIEWNDIQFIILCSVLVCCVWFALVANSSIYQFQYMYTWRVSFTHVTYL